MKYFFTVEVNSEPSVAKCLIHFQFNLKTTLFQHARTYTIVSLIETAPIMCELDLAT